ncbi:thymidylate synthase [Candidatus Woesearchaeota archaeon]|nr:thymidylate synthase [Candidatus Woesearchaeota archaeon]
MRQYQDLLKRIIEKGDVVFEPRTQTSIIQVSSGLSSYDLQAGFPLVTTKYVKPELPAEELLWKLRGEDNIASLVQRGVHFWTANAFDKYLKDTGRIQEVPKHSERWNSEFVEYDKRVRDDLEFARQHGRLGPVYGYQWRHRNDQKGGEIDRLKVVVDGLKKNRHSRYHLLNAWNDADLNDMALGPCPFWHQFTASGDNLDLTMVQRSCDTYLGVPFNVAQDALLLHMIAREVGLKPRRLEHMTINTHLYLGISPRADFWDNPENVSQFKGRFAKVQDRAEYLMLRDWYLEQAPPESEGNGNKDHMPFVLEQLSKEPRALPILTLREVTLFDAIELPADKVFELRDYDPHRWKSKAVMAA